MRNLLRSLKIFLAIVVLAALIFTLFFYQRSAWAPAGRSDAVQLQVQDKLFELEVVKTDAARQQGLSGRERLADNVGMLFVFEEAGEHCFWMKDMQFTIDMLWLDKDKKVVDLKEAVAPESYPESFCPEKPARYVIELNAGAARQAGITAGSRLNF